ncbi:hypothetical protein TPHA_0D00610 [Tetrapisispora phaffii CBS 4417]|uniref:Ubiquitin-like protease family profile domain-containing protein n=1 Tax=Tetrapisispora phaffii (strain ATCC 24235 / CBS 4417 / NBRC 1672 / NRRL Y-8282 / UCD 70-5) TaxID=1071381 RepID=G8BS84_TETPH|nr:hypothetical protein TPHA_0D00610 [Tetrapisispora phaffii CBS 4417]CCE62705.1 hypothetical protein TPHA_0D00610 [Tetrapisispora phaffii CBS 4417]
MNKHNHMIQDQSSFKRLKIDENKKTIPLKNDKRGTYRYQNERINSQRSVSSGFISKKKDSQFQNNNRRVQSLDIKNAANDEIKSIRSWLDYYKLFGNLTSNIWSLFARYDNNSILHESIHDGFLDSDQNDIQVEKTVNAFLKNDKKYKDGNGRFNWDKWQPATLPNLSSKYKRYSNDEVPIKQPYGSTFLRMKRTREYYTSSQKKLSRRSLLLNQSDEISYLRMIFNNDTDIPKLLKKERENQLLLIKEDRYIKSEIKSSIRELTDKIKHIWLDRKTKTKNSTLEATSDDLVFLKEFKTENEVNESKLKITDNLKFQIYLSNYLTETNLTKRFSKYENPEYDYKRKLKIKSSVSLIPKVSAYDTNKIKTILEEKYDRVLSDGLIAINLRDFKTLANNRWINDTIIEFYMMKIESTIPNVVAFNSFFYENLFSKGYNGVRRWMKRKKVSISQLDKIIVPVNLHQTHWVLAVIDMQKKNISYVDSLSNGPTTNSYNILQSLQQYVIEESNQQLGKDFKLVFEKSPQQINSYDCGIYLCLNSIYMVNDLPLTFSHTDAVNMRLHLGTMILNP